MIKKSNSRIFQAIYKTLAFGALFLVLFLFFSNLKNQHKAIDSFIILNNEKILVSIANTDYLRTLGLSGTKNLTKNTGKLFIFEYPDKYSFWMKDMNYPLDIIWINEMGIIVDISSNIKPDTYPETFSPSEPVKYVLEINANEAKKRNISIGDKIIFPGNF